MTHVVVGPTSSQKRSGRPLRIVNVCRRLSKCDPARTSSNSSCAAGRSVGSGSVGTRAAIATRLVSPRSSPSPLRAYACGSIRPRSRDSSSRLRGAAVRVAVSPRTRLSSLSAIVGTSSLLCKASFLARRACDSAGGQLQAISGASSSSYTPVQSETGSYLCLSVTASNSYGTTTNSFLARQILSAPLELSPPSIIGNAQVGSTLTAGTGSWQAAPVPSFSYQWLRCSSQTSCSPVTGATSAQYSWSQPTPAR